MPANKDRCAAEGGDHNDKLIADLLTKEARESTIKYSALGMKAYMPKRPATGAPKPNTRFLKSILRDTDSHNANLKRKEEKEARERMRRLRYGSKRLELGSGSRHDSYEARDKKRSTTVAGDGENERTKRIDRRSKEHFTERSEKPRSNRYSPKYDVEDTQPQRLEDMLRSGSDRRKRSRSLHISGKRTEDQANQPSSPTRRWHRPRTEDREKETGLLHPRSSHTSYGPRGSRREHDHRHGRIQRTITSTKDDDYNDMSRNNRSPRKGRPPSSATDSRPQDDSSQLSSSESDPLDALIGPMPPSVSEERHQLRSRGRGAYKNNSSNIDAHFADGYDPAFDVHLDEDDASVSSKSRRRPVAGLGTEDGDWDVALEALRDRALWRRKGADRLREAGFDDRVVERWTNNSTFQGLADGADAKNDEGNLADVRWARQGESREWDRGKFVDKNGHVDVKASW